AGPPLVKAALGEDADEAELGGAEMHATIAGTTEYLADDDAHGVALAREIISKLPWRGSTRSRGGERAFAEPRYDGDELCGVVPADPKHPCDPREVIARVVDASDFLEFKAGWGSDTV